MRVSVSIVAWTLVGLLGCEQQAPRTDPVSRTESDQQVRKLREDNEIEFKDLRGRWLAAEAALIQVKTLVDGAALSQSRQLGDLEASIKLLDTELMLLKTSVASLPTQLPAPVAAEPERMRLLRSAEEIVCLRRRGAEEAVAGVYERHGFSGMEQWSAAWTRLAQDSEFESELFERVETLCPR